MVAYLFPGQGSQQLGMGEGLFDDFAELAETADEILGYSVRTLCLEDPDQRLSLTQYTQPALYVVNALSYYRRVEESGRRPDAVAGHSLGEYNALLAADALDFATGLKLVKKRGELMAQARNGGMAAVLGMDEKEIRDLLQESGLDGIDVANLNAPAQTVISGLREDIERARPVFEKVGSCRYVVLNVSGAFHSRYMAGAQHEFAAHLDGFELRAPEIPVVANVTARRYRSDEVKETLAAQITSAVKWSETIRYLLGGGEEEFVEVGPGRVLTSLLRNIKRDAEPLVLDEEEDEATGPAVAAPAPQQPTLQQKPFASPGGAGRTAVVAEQLGSAGFRRDYGLRYACLVGAMYQGIASWELVAAAGRAGLLGFLGTGGLPPERVEADITRLKQKLTGGEPFGVNLVHDPHSPQREEQLVDLYLRHDVRTVEASAFIALTPALVRYRLTGLRRDESGQVIARNRVIAKVSRPEVATAFLSPAPAALVAELLAEGAITAAEAELARELPVAADLTCEADSGGHTDQGVSFSLVPTMLRLRDDLTARHGYTGRIRVGAAGGIGTPDAAAACFVMGADFVVTGSINQCTVEAGTSDLVKDLLQGIDIQDTGYAPAGDMFEYGARVQVLRRGVLFPARANKLYELYKNHESLDELDPATADQVQSRYFKKSFDEIYADIRSGLPPQEAERAEKDPKHRMALVFRWYFDHSTRQALAGSEEGRVDFQVHCGPALGSFNQWVKGTELEDWRHRHVGDINERLVREAAALLTRRLAALGTD
ncbi:ACP S-malonyltransferase [Streptomyces mutabilis]|uniref:[acyl-carrier-protein] S-malonyltransferase n=1 Tax=Streptomyces mutabilis TaxID=67332 RepID=A0A086MU62_9ACTN|nr:ACP S-malonyltransferase [Streptomyces mutabilis]KFG72430.1 malonyl CoA-ACP transacylase [Streptomyces mutabilis]